MLEVASFAIAVITLLVAIAAFVFVDPQRNQGVRYGLGGFFLFLTVIFILIGIFALIVEAPAEADNQSSPVPLSTQTIVESDATKSCREFGGNPVQMSKITFDQVDQWRRIGQADRNGTGIIIYCQIHQVPGYVSFAEGDTIPANVIITTDLGFFWNTEYLNSLERLVHDGGGWGVFLSLKEFVVKPASDLNHTVGGQYWYITGNN